ncbi:MAG: hypothetical protein ABFC94_15675 [Syntrophomonas sp.]
MCDCYNHKCEVCETTMPFYIADFEYPRSAFKIWCHRHVKQAPKGAVIFKFHPKGSSTSKVPKNEKWAVVGPNVGLQLGNHPNVAADWDETIKGK